MDDAARWIGFVAAAYLAGSIPFGLLVGFTRGVDIRAHGSGNIGATNAGRVLGRKIGALCFALDVLKGAIPVLIAGVVMGALGERAITAGQSAWWLGVAGASILGHVFPIWLRFKGGKGVATGFGSLAAMWPIVAPAALAALVVWLLSVRVSRYVGVSSCLAALSLPVFVAMSAGALGDPAMAPVARVGRVWPAIVAVALLAGVVIWRHRGNIRRTIAGVEPKTYLFGAGPRPGD